MALRPHCRKCGSSNVGRDDDPATGEAAIACMMCGQRQYRWNSPAAFELRDDGRQEPERGDREMAKHGPCANCGREMTIVARNLCFVCAQAGKGKEGQSRDDAMASIKQRIEAGEINSRKKRRGEAPAVAADAAASGNSVLSPGQVARARRRQIELEREDRLATSKDLFSVREEFRIPGAPAAAPPQEPSRIVPVTLRIDIEVNLIINGVRQAPRMHG